jgi:predicted NBD/HSP70 family sugar kinase
MAATIGIVATEGISAAVVENHRIKGSLRVAPSADQLLSLPAGELTEELCTIVRETSESIAAVGIAVPGMVNPDGVIAECPHLAQLKGYRLADEISQRLGIPVAVHETADAIAAGIAAQSGNLDRLIRVWTLGESVGYGRYPSGNEYWEGGHMVVTLDAHENYCPCGGVGHLESILGTRAMRLRFLDLEPDEVFLSPEKRCTDFVRYWHRALAAATATSLHLEGPGKFYVSGPSARFLQVGQLYRNLDEMVTMSTLQDYAFEIVPESQELAIIGATVGLTSKTFSSAAATA